MAAAAPSPLASSVEKTNGNKLSRLLIDGGTTVLRRIFNHYHPPAHLAANLNIHYGTLNDLLRDGHLKRPQWDKLFPPRGSHPDSKNFDITLLFLLLTNICGLCSPRGGWHRMPLHRDTTQEANIARIKFFRNELYGHVTTTGIDTPTFSSLWRDISAALRGLGLHQANIDRLKAERCGEEDYIEALLEWGDSEEDIKSQLKDMRQAQTKVQQTVDDVHKTQLEDHGILQENKLKLEEVHQVQTKTQKTMGEVHKAQLEDREILQESKVKLEEVQQIQTITQETIDRVRQSQLEDREMIQGSNAKLREVYQINREMHQVVTDVRKTQVTDRRAIQQMCQNTEQCGAKLHEVHMTLQSHGELLRTHQQFKQTDEKRETYREDEILEKLAKIDTQRIIKQHTENYVEGTRVSILSKVKSWVDDRSSPNRVIVICGNPGMGKSVISAVTCLKMQDVGRLAGSHFCQHDKARHRNPKVMLQSLASHLADSLPAYKKALVEKLSRNLGVEINNMEVKDLFELLFEEPLASLDDPGVTYLMVIDGIDESEYQGRNELLDVIADYFKKLPTWIRFLVTTRPEVNIADRLECLQPFQLEPNNKENLEDIRLCFEKQLSHMLVGNQEVIFQELARKSEGVMLFAHYLVNFIKENVPLPTPEVLNSTLPTGISSVYHSYFKRLETELRKELDVTEDQFMGFLSAVAAAREPLPLGFLPKLLLSGKSPFSFQRKVNAAISCVSALLSVQGGHIHFFHKSVKDWLVEKTNHHFNVDEKDGHHVLSKLCIEEFDDLKRKGVNSLQFNDTTKYALQHGVQHMLQVEENRKAHSFEKVVQRYVLDLEVVYAKLCVNTIAAFEDILCVQEQEGVEASGKCHEALSSFLLLLRKHISTLKHLPSALFQTFLNEGGPGLSSEALNLLETRYPQIPHMEYMDKDMERDVQVRFLCPDAVICFDVSPDLDYMVCECEDSTIHLWSLRTGEHLWKHHTKVQKDHYKDIFMYHLDRWPDCISDRCSRNLFYRSVVFHPTLDLVLPGVLSHAYTFEGDLKPLHPSSRCRFSVCSISADKTKMLTDCPRNAKSIIMWSLTDGSEILHFAWDKDILSFAWSSDGWLLAISTYPFTICLVDMMDGFKTLAQTSVSSPCGMINFSPDCRFIFGLHLGGYDFCDYSDLLYCFRVKMDDLSKVSLDSVPGDSYHLWEFESPSKTGFLLGDPFCFPSASSSGAREFAFVLNTQSVLRVFSHAKVIKMVHRDDLQKDTLSVDEHSNTVVKEAVFSFNSDTLYVIAQTGLNPKRRSLKAWDNSSGKFKSPGIQVHGEFCCLWLFAVREGILCSTNGETLELWNFELSECIRSWPNLKKIQEVRPISEELVACKVSKTTFDLNYDEVTILDTTSGDIVSTIASSNSNFPFNSKCEAIIAWMLSSAKEIYSEERFGCVTYCLYTYHEGYAFSPNDQYCVIRGRTRLDIGVDIDYGYGDAAEREIFVLEAVLGRILHTLCKCYGPSFDCKFISDEVCVIGICDMPRGHCLRLYNVKSGDLLIEIPVESKVHSLAVCPDKNLVAIVLENSKHSLEVLKVKLPRDKDNRKNKKIKLQELDFKDESSDWTGHINSI